MGEFHPDAQVKGLSGLRMTALISRSCEASSSAKVGSIIMVLLGIYSSDNNPEPSCRQSRAYKPAARSSSNIPNPDRKCCSCFIPNGLRMSKNLKSRKPASKVKRSVVIRPLNVVKRKVRACPATSSVTTSGGSAPQRRSQASAAQRVSRDARTASVNTPADKDRRADWKSDG